MNTYLITSESYKLLKEEVNKIINDSLNVIKFDLRKDSIDDVLTEATYFSLMSEMKYLVVGINDLLKTKKKKQEEEESENEDEEDDEDNKTKIILEKLEKYLDKPNELCTLILTTSYTPDKRKKVYKKIDKEGKVISIPTPSKKDLIGTCDKLLKEHKYFAKYDVLSYIVDNSFCNYDIMTNELDKIYLIVPPKSLVLKDIEGIVNETLKDNIYKYMTALFNGNLSDAVELSKDFDRLNIEPAVLIASMSKEIENAYLVKQGMSKIELKEYLGKFEDYQVDRYFDFANYFTLNELKKIIIKLNDYDYKYKSGKIDKSVLIDLLTIDLCD